MRSNFKGSCINCGGREMIEGNAHVGEILQGMLAGALQGPKAVLTTKRALAVHCDDCKTAHLICPHCGQLNAETYRPMNCSSCQGEFIAG